MVMGSAAPKTNAVDFENHVWGHDLKGFISYTTPIDATQPFRLHSRTPYLNYGISHSEHWRESGVGGDVALAEGSAKIDGGGVFV
jgi:hypothetical protein